MAVAAIAALVFAACQFLPSLTARVETRHLIAESPYLLSDRDRVITERLGLTPHIIETPYWRSSAYQHDLSRGKGYLFAMIVNFGPAIADEFQFSPIERNGTIDQSSPQGLDVAGSHGPLPEGHYYAVLLDVLEPIDPEHPWDPPNFDLSRAHFRSILFHITYRDRWPCIKRPTLPWVSTPIGPRHIPPPNRLTWTPGSSCPCASAQFARPCEKSGWASGIQGLAG